MGPMCHRGPPTPAWVLEEAICLNRGWWPGQKQLPRVRGQQDQKQRSGRILGPLQQAPTTGLGRRECPLTGTSSCFALHHSTLPQDREAKLPHCQYLVSRAAGHRAAGCHLRVLGGPQPGPLSRPCRAQSFCSRSRAQLWPALAQGHALAPPLHTSLARAGTEGCPALLWPRGQGVVGQGRRTGHCPSSTRRRASWLFQAGPRPHPGPKGKDHPCSVGS